MALIKSKQVSRLLQAFISLTSFSFTAGSSIVVTSAITTAASTAGDGGTAVPVQVFSTTTEGFLTTGTNLVPVWASATKAKLVDATNNEVYGRLTEASGVYTLSLFSLIAGTETAFTLGSTTNVDFAVPYQFTFEHFPVGSLLLVPEKYVGDDPTATGGRARSEVVSITGANTLAALSVAAVAGYFFLYINGKEEDTTSGSGVTVSGTAITWTAATTGYALATTDRAVAFYTY
jgi:hypothetical protein